MTDWFGITSTADMLAKAEREYARVTAIPDQCNDDQARQRLDHAMNCAITIWHVADWLRKDAWAKLVPLCKFRPNSKKKKSDNIKRFINWVENEPEGKSILLCQDLCNGVKHVEITLYVPDAGGTVVSARDPRPLLPDTGLSMTIAPFKILKIILGNGTRIEMIPVLQKAIKAWTDILNRHHLP